MGPDFKTQCMSLCLYVCVVYICVLACNEVGAVFSFEQFYMVSFLLACVNGDTGSVYCLTLHIVYIYVYWKY